MIREMSRVMAASKLNNKPQKLQEVFLEMGYAENLTYSDYEFMFERVGIATRIITALVDATWRTHPIAIDKTKRKINAEADQADDPSVIETAIKALNDKHGIIKTLKQADTLCCIGQYSILVIGDKLGKYEEPLSKSDSLYDLMQIDAYSEEQAKVSRFVTDTKNPRYGLPEMYTVSVKGDETTKRESYSVHHTRVIHIADDLVSSKLNGTPKLKSVYNHIMELVEILGSTRTIYRNGARRVNVFTEDPETLTTDDANAEMNAKLEEFEHGLRHNMLLKGVSVNSISPSFPGATGVVNDLMDQIVAGSRTPHRILMGSEQAVLAGNSDQDSWHSRVAGRRECFAADSVLIPLIKRLQDYGYIQKVDFEIIWEPLLERSKSEKITDTERLVRMARTVVGNAGEVTKVITIEEIRDLAGLEPDVPETKYDEMGVYEDSEGELPMQNQKPWANLKSKLRKRRKYIKSI